MVRVRGSTGNIDGDGGDEQARMSTDRTPHRQ